MYSADTSPGRVPDEQSRMRPGASPAGGCGLLARWPGDSVGRDGAGRVLGAPAPEPHEPGDGEDADERAHPRVDPDAEDLIGGVDAEVLEEEAPERVRREVQREHLALAQPEAPLDQQDDAQQEQAVQGL